MCDSLLQIALPFFNFWEKSLLLFVLHFPGLLAAHDYAQQLKFSVVYLCSIYHLRDSPCLNLLLENFLFIYLEIALTCVGRTVLHLPHLLLQLL